MQRHITIYETLKRIGDAESRALDVWSVSLTCGAKALLPSPTFPGCEDGEISAWFSMFSSYGATCITCDHVMAFRCRALFSFQHYGHSNISLGMTCKGFLMIAAFEETCVWMNIACVQTRFLAACREGECLPKLAAFPGGRGG